MACVSRSQLRLTRARSWPMLCPPLPLTNFAVFDPHPVYEDDTHYPRRSMYRLFDYCSRRVREVRITGPSPVDRVRFMGQPGEVVQFIGQPIMNH